MSEVVWREWGTEAFAEARRLDRPILLDIGAVWCHWCHVMDHGIVGDPVHTGTYSDPDIIAAINRDFVPIKVDNDRRPDINARYNMGGWPTTAFLTPDGDPLYGATYLTPAQMAGLLDSIASYYRGNKDEILGKISQYAERRMSSRLEIPASAAVTSEILVNVESEIKRSFDRAFGGFGTQPKFPHPDALNFSLLRFAETNDDDLRRIAEKTLFEMSSGGMYDQFAGGFFRYSTTRDWSVPHYEKMLEDNSRLLSTNLLAYSVLEDSYFKEIALDVKRFLMEVLFDSVTGTFAGSQDADQEEAYYGRPISEREFMPTPFIDWTVYADWNGLVVTAFTHLYQLIGDSEALTIAIRLYDFLASNIAPNHYFHDGRRLGPENQFSDITALVGAAIDLFESTGVRRYLSEARGIADIALSELFNEDVSKFQDIPLEKDALGSLSVPQFDLEDNAHFACHLIRLAAHTGNARYRNIAESVLKSFVSVYREQSYFSAGFAISVATFLNPSVHIVLVGDIGSTAMEALKFSAFRVFATNKTVELRTPEDSREYLPDADNRPIAYVCIGEICSMPTADASELEQLIRQSKVQQ